MKYKLKHHLNTENALFEVLTSRGITDVEYYLDKSARDNDPMGLDNILTGARMILDSIQKKETIFIQIDADADGYTSSAILYNYLINLDPEAKVLTRVHTGKQHGVIVDEVPEAATLVIIPDAGTNQVEEHKMLTEMGKKVLVIDHHPATRGELYEQPYPWGCIINNQMSERYPNKTLCGAGVVYKVCQVLDSLTGKQLADTQIDLVALGLISDMMDLRDPETHYLVSKGLKNITNVGFMEFVDKQSYSIGDTENMTPTSVAFYITPLINAIVRVGTQDEKQVMFQAFVDGLQKVPSTKRGAKPGDTETAAGQTARCATNARNRQNRLKEKALELMEMKISKYNLDQNKVIVLIAEDKEIPSELTGLVAMQLTAKYKKPVIITKENDEGICRGSARGENNSPLPNLKDFFNESGFFEYAEGHQTAHGVSIARDKIDAFIHYVDEELKNVEFDENVYMVDYILSSFDNIADIIIDLGRGANLWGQGIEEPIIAIQEVCLKPDNIKFIGSNSDTTKFTINGVTYIKFKDLDFKEKIQKCKLPQLDIVGRCNINEWNGTYTPQVLIVDYNLKDSYGQF